MKRVEIDLPDETFAGLNREVFARSNRRRSPKLFPEIVLAGGQRIARMFGLSMRMIPFWSAYRQLSGPRLLRRMTPVVLEGGACDAASSHSQEVGVSTII
jgi:hypothetical protein